MSNPLWELEDLNPAEQTRKAVKLIEQRLAEAEELYAKLPASIEQLKAELARWQALHQALDEAYIEFGFTPSQPPTDNQCQTEGKP
ncbi:hypothetical protein ACFP6B_08595 [Rothia nasimurium]|uniref:hypothetical protein n=1 Tax=Rothia nasimurium TaxID=85336 RepID=UPI0036228164